MLASLIAIAQVAEEAMGGTSGALYSCVSCSLRHAVRIGLRIYRHDFAFRIFFSALAQGLQSQSLGDGSTLTDKNWANALSSALDKLYTYTRARRPSRTLVDPLSAFIEAVKSTEGTDMANAVRLAAEAAEQTKNLQAKAGRSAYVESDQLQKEQVADPGAWGVKVILETLRL